AISDPRLSETGTSVPVFTLRVSEGRRALQLALEGPARDRARRHRDLPALPHRRPGLDARHGARRVGDRARHRRLHRHPAHHAAQVGSAAGQPVRRDLPQHPAHRADVPVVLRDAGAGAARSRRLDQADAAALGLVHPGGAVPGHLHLGARRRAGARRDPVAAARAAPGGHRDGADGSADLPLRHPAAELPHHPAAAHLGVHEHHQELLGRADHRAARAHRARARDAGVQLPGVRGVHRGDRDLPAHQPGGGAAHARGREKAARARPDRGRRHAAGGALMSGFDFDVIERSLPYLFREGMTFTLTLTALAMTGGIVFGTLLAMMRLSAFKPLSILAGAYVNLMRSIPLVLVIFWFFFLVPYIGAWVLREPNPIKVGTFWSALITFTM